jgi:FHA domain-containing protein
VFIITDFLISVFDDEDNHMSESNLDPEENNSDNNSSQTKVITGSDAGELLGRNKAPLDSASQLWRIAMTIIDIDIQIVFDLRESIVLGRSYPHPELFDGIDLSPYSAYESGVSRNHAIIKQKDDSVLLVDNDSVNGTLLNGKKLVGNTTYPLKSGDQVRFGKLDVRFEFLYNPFNS